jgi:hypothetical protein
MASTKIALMIFLSLIFQLNNLEFSKKNLCEDFYHKDDSIFIVSYIDEYFDYFKGTMDKFAVIDFSEEKYRKVLSMHKTSKKGFIRIYFRDLIIFEYRIVDEVVQGVGSKYDYKTGQVIIHGLFKDSKLNGPLLFYNENFEVDYIAKYRKGKFIKFLYHKKAKDNTDLKEINKNAKDPMQYILYIM